MMKRILPFAFCAQALLLSHMQCAEASRSSIVITVDPQDVFGEPVATVMYGEPIWLGVVIANTDKNAVTLRVPVDASTSAVVKATGGDDCSLAVQPPISTNIMSRFVTLRQGDKVEVSIFVGDSLRFVRKGEQTIRVSMNISSKERPMESMEGFAIIKVSGPMTTEQREDLLLRMKNRYAQASAREKRRLVRSLLVIPSGGQHWAEIANLSLRDDLEGVQIEAVGTIHRTDLSIEQQNQLLSIAAASGKGAARVAAQIVLDGRRATEGR